MAKLLLISTWFQVIWFCAVVGQDSLQWLTVTMVAVTYLVTALRTQVTIARLIAVSMLGVVLDVVNKSIGIIIFEPNDFPIWLLALWFIFSWYANFITPLVNRYPLRYVAIVGGVSGSLSYIAGEKLGAVAFGFPLLITAAILFVQWAMVVTIALKVFSDGNTNSHVKPRFNT